MIYIIHIGNFQVELNEDLEVSSSPKLVRTIKPCVKGSFIYLTPKLWRELTTYLPVLGSYQNKIFYSLPQTLISNVETAQSILHEGQLLEVMDSLHSKLEESLKTDMYPTIRIETQTTEECLGQVRDSL